MSSSGQGVATVNSSGLVAAVANGSATITATTDGVNGTATVVVDQASTQSTFTAQPTKTGPGTSITPAVAVELWDALGHTVADATDVVTLSLGNNPSGGSLAGTLTRSAVNGVATFDDLSIDNAGAGYTLSATSGTLAAATSEAFDIGDPIWAVISAGGFGMGATCGLTPEGVAYCWGTGFRDRLGNGTSNIDSHVPVAVSGGLTFQSISTGLGQAGCGVTTGGLSYCWGTIASSYFQSDVPAAVPGGLTFQSIIAGYVHNCGIVVGDDAYCWGRNNAGQLGDGSTTAPAVLTAVAVSGGLKFQLLSSGGGDNSKSHTCGITLTGDAFCWGENGEGQLGNGSMTNSDTPIAVSGGLKFQSLDGGGGGRGENDVIIGHTCAITLNGDAHCWGSNSWGQLGNGSTTSNTTPVAVSGGLVFQSISAGYHHTCGLTTAGAAYCWGRNRDGQLGNGSTMSSPTPATPVAVSGGLVFQSISAGWDHTCGITTTGDGYCWGGDDEGELGNGGGGGASTPARVSDPQ